MTNNPYQSFLDWIFGQWTCPDCGQEWRSFASPYLNDCTLVTVDNGEVVERRVECPGCGFVEVVG